MLRRTDREFVAVPADLDHVLRIDLLLQQGRGQRVSQSLLDDAFERSGAVGRIKPLLDEPFPGMFVDFKREFGLGKLVLQPLELEANDFLDLGPAQRVKDDGLIDPVEELGEECSPKQVLNLGRIAVSLPAPDRSAMIWLPRLDVMMMTVFRKSTVRPWPSVSRPSSST